MSRVARYAAMGGVMDFTVYIALSLVPLLSKRGGAGPVALGLLPVTGGAAYVIVALFGGRISDRFSRTFVARIGMGIATVTFALFALADRWWQYYFGMPVVATGLALFWPALQAAIADESDPPTLSRNLGWFNVAWGAGKGLGVLTGGLLVDSVGRGGFLAAAAIGVVFFVVMPSVPSGGGRGSSLAGKDDGVPPPVRERFRSAALLANFATYGLAATVINLYPLWNSEMRRGGESYGIVVGAVFLSQTAAFGLLTRFSGWRYRRWPLIGPQLLCAGGAALLATRLPVWATLPFAAAVGAGLGMAYSASIYYSLHSDARRGGRAGLHEAILGSGNLLIPLLGGVAAKAAAAPAFPCLFAGAVVFVAGLAQAAMLGTMGRPGRGTGAVTG